MAANATAPMTLSRLFEPPDDFRGEAGVVCGLSADAAFMNIALERFTGLMVGGRGTEGKIRVALILDPSNPAIAPASVPGMRHLPLRDRPPFPLLHAKVALLSFRRAHGEDERIVRLIVSTGNWSTGQNIDLFWTIEISSDELGLPTKKVPCNGADILAAWDFLVWILKECCDRNIDPEQPPVDLSMLRDLYDAIGRLRNELPPIAGPTRFFDNRDEALIDGMMKRIKPLAGGSTRNSLSMGSGFFNNTKSEDELGDGVFTTIEGIRERLVNEKLLGSRTKYLDLVVNSEKCQGVAAAADRLEKANWNFWKPSYFNETTERFLHAKFIFSARYSENLGEVSQSWLYMGSGNLTRQGFMERQGVGNLEAGVLIATETLDWQNGRKKVDYLNLANFRLPLLLAERLTPDSLIAGERMPERVPLNFAPPISFFFWKEDVRGGLLMPPEPNEGARAEFIVLGPEERACDPDLKGFRWLGNQPRQVTVQWGGGHETSVPVIGPDGRVAGVPLQPREINELWDELNGFPDPPEEEEEEEQEDRRKPRDKHPGDKPHKANRRLKIAVTPIRSVVCLVENIGSRQRGMKQSVWKAWCARLEQTLIRASKTIDVAEFQKLKVNPLSPLLDSAFRPDFAQAGRPEGELYEATIASVEKEWNVATLRRIGNRS